MEGQGNKEMETEVIQIKIPKQYKEILVNTLFELAKDHRYRCDGSCSISLFVLRDIIEQLIDRPLEHEEFKIFS